MEGVIIRCGYGDDIASQDDIYWKRNADECTRLGIPFGVYIYSYATSMAQAESEAQHALRCVKGYKLSYPIYLDLEHSGTEAGAVDRAKRFGDIIEAAGYWCGIYANLSWWNNYLPGLDRFTKWIAQYNSQCDYTGKNKDMWQYTSGGRVAGISENVDMNECYKIYPQRSRAAPDQPALQNRHLHLHPRRLQHREPIQLRVADAVRDRRQVRDNLSAFSGYQWDQQP